MNKKSKKLMTAGLALSAIGIWVPQLLMGVVDRSPAPRADVPNDGAKFESATPGLAPDAGAGAFAEGSAMGAGPEPGATKITSSTPGIGDERSLADALSQATRQIELHAPVAQRVDLSELLGTFRSAGDSLSPMGNQDGLDGSQSGAGMGYYSAISPQAQLADYCRENALSAIIHGEGDGVAMINGTLVHPGDVLPGGIRVTQIGRRSVSLSLRGATQDMGLPAFEARESSGTQSQQSGPSTTPTSETTPGSDDTSEPGGN